MKRTAGEYKLAQRRRAADGGLCRTCCAVGVPPGRSTCPKCSSDAAARSARRRSASRAKSETERGIIALEDSGDAYFSDGDYRAALKNYQRAFSLAAVDASAHMRLAGKVGRAALHRGVASGADAWFNIPLAVTPPASVPSAHVADFHLQQIRALWSSSRTVEAVALSERILALALLANDAELVLAMQLSLATVLHLLCRYEEAEGYLWSIDVASLSQDHHLLCMYHRVRGFVEAVAGDAEGAFASFASALQHAEHDRDAYRTVTVLITQALSATSLGRIDLAAESFRTALATARENNQAWNVAYISLEYAQVLSRRGEAHLARAYVNEAATLENPPPVVLEALAEIGILIALECDDAHLLRRCANEAALAFAFSSGEPPRLGPVAASFARYYHKLGRLPEARDLLARALDVVTRAEQNYDLALAVAEFGEVRDRGRARELLRARTRLPNADLAIAHLHYFDSLVFRRDGKLDECARDAALAAARFRALHWASHAAASSALCDVAAVQPPVTPIDAGAGLVPFKLSLRQRNVAELVMSGLSNTEVAERLSITTRTVETHMTEILRRVGVRSRYQLITLKYG